MVSARTLRMLRYIAECGEVPLHVLLRAFWPERATEEALPELRTWVHRQQRAGNVAQAVPRALDSVVKLSPQGARIFEERVHSGSVGHPRARAHHAATLLFVERIKEQLGPNQQLASVTLEPELRSEAQRGVGSKKGQSYDSFPDAVVVIREMMPDGTISSKRVAVEYVTSKYTSKDITEKAVSFAATYDGVLWAADNTRTMAQSCTRRTPSRCCPIFAWPITSCRRSSTQTWGAQNAKANNTTFVLLVTRCSAHAVRTRSVASAYTICRRTRQYFLNWLIFQPISNNNKSLTLATVVNEDI